MQSHSDGLTPFALQFCLVRYLSLTCLIALFCVQWDIPDNRTSCHAAVRLVVVAEMVSMVSGAIHYV